MKPLKELKSYNVEHYFNDNNIKPESFRATELNGEKSKESVSLLVGNPLDKGHFTQDEESINMINSLIMSQVLKAVTSESKKSKMYSKFLFGLLFVLGLLFSSVGILVLINVFNIIFSMGLSFYVNNEGAKTALKLIDGFLLLFVLIPVALTIIDFKVFNHGKLSFHVALFRRVLKNFASNDLMGGDAAKKESHYQILRTITDNDILTIPSSEIKKDIEDAYLMEEDNSELLNSMIDYYSELYLLEYLKKHGSLKTLSEPNLSDRIPLKSWKEVKVEDLQLENNSMVLQNMFLNAMKK